jgi:hypothetical protein
MEVETNGGPLLIEKNCTGNICLELIRPPREGTNQPRPVSIPGLPASLSFGTQSLGDLLGLGTLSAPGFLEQHGMGSVPVDSDLVLPSKKLARPAIYSIYPIDLPP